jgi:hypothetical protein
LNERTIRTERNIYREPLPIPKPIKRPIIETGKTFFRSPKFTWGSSSGKVEELFKPVKEPRKTEYTKNLAGIFLGGKTKKQFGKKDIFSGLEARA